MFFYIHTSSSFNSFNFFKNMRLVVCYVNMIRILVCVSVRREKENTNTNPTFAATNATTTTTNNNQIRGTAGSMSSSWFSTFSKCFLWLFCY